MLSTDINCEWEKSFGHVRTMPEDIVPPKGDKICINGDTPGALATIRGKRGTMGIAIHPVNLMQ